MRWCGGRGTGVRVQVPYIIALIKTRVKQALEDPRVADAFMKLYAEAVAANQQRFQPAFNTIESAEVRASGNRDLLPEKLVNDLKRMTQPH